MTMGGGDGYKSVVYFVNWAIYGRNHHPQDLPADKLTHVLYAFANVRPDSGEVYLTDSWSDVEKHYPTDSWNDTGTNLYGCLKQLNLLKRQHRRFKTLLSIGGWTYSANFASPASTPQGRATFARTAVRLLADHGFDGLDIDWEYPQSAEQGQHLLQLLQTVRAELDAYAADLASRPDNPVPGTAPHFLLTIATPAGPQNYQHQPLAALAQVCDFLNLMAYDYAGSWDAHAGHQANLHPHPSNPTSTPFSTTRAVGDYIAAGVPPHKIILGMPLYGRAFLDTDGPGTPFHGIGEGSWEQGVWDVKDLPRPGAEVRYDPDVVASYGYCPARREMVSFDTVEVAGEKTRWLMRERLGGAMWWESSGDAPAEGSRVAHVVAQLGGPMGRRLDAAENWVWYPDSRFENLRRGFPGEC